MKDWENWINSQDPHLIPTPFNYDLQLTPFQKLLLIKIFREEKTIYAMMEFVSRTLGKKFSSNVAATIEEAYKDTDFQTPLIFIISAGADPLLNILRFAKDKKIPSDKFTFISLGQGQGPLAERAIDNSMKTGGWVVLQNCHLGKSFMPDLEKKLESFNDPEINSNIAEDFRLFLTSKACNYFPVLIFIGNFI